MVRYAHAVHLGGSPARVWDSLPEEAVLTQSERKNRNEAGEEEREGVLGRGQSTEAEARVCNPLEKPRLAQGA